MVLTLLLFFNAPIKAQAPSTAIMLFDYEIEDGVVSLDNPKLLTDFNAGGYNNQPSFFSEDLLYISSDHRGDNNTEIIALDLSANKLTRVTKTTQSEYSPTMMPDGKHFSVIRQKNTEPMDQHLWQYPIDRSGEGKAIIDDLTNVGYHCWIGPYKVIMFLVDDPHQMVEYNTVTGEQEIIAKDIGRSLYRRGNVLYYLEKVSRKFWYIKAYNFVHNTVEVVTQALREKEDFAIAHDGTFIMSSGSILFAFSPDKDKTWRKVVDLKDHGLSNVTRIALTDSKIAMVYDSNK